jgi:hypothetical protein
MNRRITRAHALVGAVALCCVLVAPLTATGSVGDSGGPEATASGIKKQVKKLKKKVKKLQQQVDEIARQPGPQGEQGLPGQDATNLFAYIRDNGGADTATVQYGSGVAVSDPSGNGNTYQVFFNQPMVNCVVQATAGNGNPAGVPTAISSFPLVNMATGGPNQVEVLFVGDTGTATDTSFLITAFC